MGMSDDGLVDGRVGHLSGRLSGGQLNGMAVGRWASVWDEWLDSSWMD